MEFTSLAYVFFLAVVFAVYWRLEKRRQNLFLLAASYYFYASWDWRFLSLIIVATLVNYHYGKKIYTAKSPKTKRLYLALPILVNMGILGAFKYFNFFVENAVYILDKLGLPLNYATLSIILPVGISFYTFQSLSYSFDIYRKKIKPTNDIVAFSLFVAFFPQLVAGPIERASRLLPQINAERTFSSKRFFSGVDLILWGLLKKMVVADNLGFYVDMTFALNEPSTLIMLVGALGFAIQVFADFSAYTDIARGSARLLGFELVENFKSPYLAADPAEFWRRWHISFITWIRDYVYIPLGGSRVAVPRYLLNVFAVWFLVGLWHGAAWHFIIWGLYSGCLVVVTRQIMKSSIHGTIPFKWVFRPFTVAFTFAATVFGWLIFRAPTMGEFLGYFSQTALELSKQHVTGASLLAVLVCFYCIPLWAGAAARLINEKRPFSGEFLMTIRPLLYAVLYICLTIFMNDTPNDFIYFQF